MGNRFTPTVVHNVDGCSFLVATKYAWLGAVENIEAEFAMSFPALLLCVFIFYVSISLFYVLPNL